MKCWVARSESKTHIRLQLEPFTFDWPGWDLRESEISPEDYATLCEFPLDGVELERLHQEAWLAGVPITVGTAPPVSEHRDLV